MKIAISHRAAFVGTTGSGKSYLMMRLLAASPRLVCLNSGNDPNMIRDWRLTDFRRGYGALKDGGPGRLHVPPPNRKQAPTAAARLAYWDRIFDMLFDLRNVHIVIDELYAVGPAQGSEGVRNLYTMGRKFNISTWGATQRPRRIPLFVLSEAEWLFAGRLNVRDDRKYVGEMIGMDLLPRLSKFDFVIGGPELDDPILARWEGDRLTRLQTIDQT